MAVRKTKAAGAAPAARSETKRSGTAAKSVPTPIAREITQEMIAQRAYDIYASRGYAPGNPQDDWFEAERQLRAGL